LGGADLGFDGLALVDALAAEIFNDEADVIGIGEGLEVSLEEEVWAFTADGAANEEEAVRFLGRQSYGGDVGVEAIWVDTEGDDFYFGGVDTGVDVDAADVVGVGPDFVDGLGLIDPFGGEGAELPGLDEDPRAVGGTFPLGWPGVADGDLGGGWGLEAKSAGAAF